MPKRKKNLVIKFFTVVNARILQDIEVNKI